MPATLLAFVLLAQAPKAAPTSPQTSTAAASLTVNSTVVIPAASFAALDRAALDELLAVSTGAAPQVGGIRAKMAALVDSGRAVYLMDSTRVVIHATFADNRFVDAAKQPIPCCSGPLSEGPHALEDVFLAVFQFGSNPTVEHASPASAELTQAQVANKAAEDREQEVYRAYKAAHAEAKSRASRSDLSVRKKVEQRWTTNLIDTLVKKYHLKDGELDQIVARGEAKDGTAARHAAKKNPSKLAAKANNAMILGQIGAVLDAQANQFAAANQWRPTNPFTSRSFNPLGPGGTVANRGTNTITSGQNFKPLTGR